MAVTATPIFIQTPKSAAVALTATANTNVDGTTGTYTTILTAGANGSRVERIRITCANAAQAEKVRLFAGTSGAEKLIGEYLFASNTPSNTVTSLMTDIDCSQPGTALILSASAVLKANVNTGTSALIYVYVAYGDY